MNQTVNHRQEQYRLRQQCLALAQEVGVTIEKGNRGGWVYVVLKGGKMLPKHGWLAVKRYLTQRKRDLEVSRALALLHGM
jgi:hypothetical protein